MILQNVRENKTLTKEGLCTKTGLSDSTAKREIAYLKWIGVLKRAFPHALIFFLLQSDPVGGMNHILRTYCATFEGNVMTIPNSTSHDPKPALPHTVPPMPGLKTDVKKPRGSQTCGPQVCEPRDFSLFLQIKYNNNGKVICIRNVC